MLERALLHDAMRRALDLARRGPQNNPNPRVGCTIVDPEGRIISEGWHRGAGTAHAEIEALTALPARWRARAKELTAVVTLEPCNHTGRTGPCAQALTEFGIGAVAYALSDPGGVSSGGARRLAEAGIEVLGGVLSDEALTVLTPWLTRVSADTTATGERVHVTVKWAQTLDGRAAAADGSSRWITGAQARADVHQRRAAADAILVGTGTLLADNPSLTARTPDGALLVPPEQQPIPVVLGRREIPDGSRIFEHPALAARKLPGPLTFTGDNLGRDLLRLHEQGVRTVFVEGGPSVSNSLIAAGLADRAVIYVAPALLGGPILSIQDLGIDSMGAIMRFNDWEVTRLGPDLLIDASLRAHPNTASPPSPPRKDSDVHRTR